MKFDYGTNAYNTVNSSDQKLSGFYLILATTMELQLSEVKFDNIIDKARSMLLYIRP